MMLSTINNNIVITHEGYKIVDMSLQDRGHREWLRIMSHAICLDNTD